MPIERLAKEGYWKEDLGRHFEQLYLLYKLTYLTFIYSLNSIWECCPYQNTLAEVRNAL
nr:hypothetical protein Q903MT_gene5407 [Picea sitchensis]